MINLRDIFTNWKSYLPLLVLVFMGVFFILESTHFPIHDYGNYYFGGYFFTHSMFNENIYFPEFFNQTVASLGYSKQFLSFAPNTPFLAMVFSPFSLFPLAISKLIFSVISLSLLVVSLVRLTQYFNLDKAYIILLPIVFLIPIRNNILFGQVYFLLFFLLSEGILAYHKEKYFKMAICWSLAILFKVFPIILFGFLIAKKKYKAAIILLLVLGVFLVLTIWVTGFQIWKFYFTEVLSRANNGEIAGAFVDNYQSLFMFLKRLLVWDSIENPNALFTNFSLVISIVIGVKVFLISLVLLATSKVKGSFFNFSFWMLISLILSPYGSTYSLLTLIFLYLSIGKLEVSASVKYTLILLLFLMANSSIFPFSMFPFNYARLFIIVLIIGTFIWILRDSVPIKKLTIGAVIISCLFYWSTETEGDKSMSVSPTMLPILTYNYEINVDKITYFYWNSQGENRSSFRYLTDSFSEENVEIIDNQIYYQNTQLTFDHSNKKKPILVNGNEIVFLSDKNRGVGFYELRKIDLEIEK